MEIIIVLAVVVIGAIWYFNRDNGLDVNKDGKVDLNDVKAAAANTVTAVKESADVNKDGKVDAKDAKAAVKKTVARSKAVVKKATKKPAVRKPKTSK